jgi:hypothetical protein
VILAIDLSYIPFIMVRYITYIPSFIRAFIMNGCWILSKAFFIYWDDLVVFVFASINMLHYM